MSLLGVWAAVLTLFMGTFSVTIEITTTSGVRIRLWVTHVSNISLPESGEIRVNLACVCNVNEGATDSVVTTANMGPSAHMGSLARRSITGLHRCVSRRMGMRNSLHHSATFSVGELVRVNSCHNVHRHGNLPMENRASGGGTHAHGNPGGAVTGGGGWKES